MMERSKYRATSRLSASSSRFPRVFFRGARAASVGLLAGRPREGGGPRFGPSLGDLLAGEELRFQQCFNDGFLQASSVLGPDLPLPPQPPGSSVSVREHEHSIHEIEVLNRGDSPVLFTSGLIFRGGAQDRALLESRLFGKGLHKLEVYCVEQGRWEEQGRAFSPQAVLPDLLRFHLHERDDSGNMFVRQSELWRFIQESLLGMGALGSTLNVEGWREIPPPFGASVASVVDQPRLRGTVLLDSQVGLASLSLLPGRAFFPQMKAHTEDEQRWRRLFAERVITAREYFRIYDEKGRVALRCTPDGRALRDLEGEFLLFHFAEEDLEGSFVPPMESPPEQRERPLPEVENFDSPQAFFEKVNECVVRTAVEGEVRRLLISHPERPIFGEGILFNDRMVSLQVHALRAA